LATSTTAAGRGGEPFGGGFRPICGRCHAIRSAPGRMPGFWPRRMSHKCDKAGVMKNRGLGRIGDLLSP
jgi:hypothetical protein